MYCPRAVFAYRNGSIPEIPPDFDSGQFTVRIADYHAGALPEPKIPTAIATHGENSDLIAEFTFNGKLSVFV